MRINMEGEGVNVGRQGLPMDERGIRHSGSVFKQLEAQA